MQSFWMNFWRDEEGATAIEYGLIAALVAVAAIGGMGLVGTNLESLFQNIAGKISGAAGTEEAPCTENCG